MKDLMGFIPPKKKSLNKKSLESFTLPSEFRETKRFLRFKQDVIAMMNDYLKNNVSTARIINEDEYNPELETSGEAPDWKRYYRLAVMTQFAALSERMLGNDDTALQALAQMDRTGQIHYAGWSIMWDMEDKYIEECFANDNEYDGLPENLCYEYLMGRSSGAVSHKIKKKFEHIPSADIIIEREFEELCLEYIREKEMVENNFNEASWYRLSKIETREELFNFMARLGRNVNDSVWQVIRFQTDYCRAMQEESQAGKLKKQISQVKAEGDMALEKERQHSVYLENQLIAARNKIAELERKIYMVKEECNKQHKAEIYSTWKAKEKSDKKGQELEEKYNALKERNKFLEELLEEAEAKNASDNEDEYKNDAEFFQKKYVFVRNKAQEGYLIFQELAKKFPNAVFTNGIANDIDPKNTDGVVLLTRWEKHGIYWGMRDACKAAGVPYAHCDTANLDRICSIMYDIFVRQGERRNSYKY